MVGKTQNKFTTRRDQEKDNITNVMLLEQLIIIIIIAFALSI